MRLSFIILTSISLHFISHGSAQTAPNQEYWESFDVLKICNSGKKQSPIDIKERTTEAKTGSSITFSGYNLPKKFVLKNDGTTAKFTISSDSDAATISAPHLSNGSVFKFAQLHFHWGGDNKYGSEHLLDGFQAPIEVHLVHFNTKYGATLTEALAKKDVNDNLAVLGILFDIIPCSPPGLSPVVQRLSDIVVDGTKLTIDNLALEQLLPDDINTFFSYEGSLTTPRCQEIVAWTVFKDRNFISQTQLNEFRKLMSKGQNLENNYRSVQPLNDRKVYMYTK